MEEARKLGKIEREPVFTARVSNIGGSFAVFIPKDIVNVWGLSSQSKLKVRILEELRNISESVENPSHNSPVVLRSYIGSIAAASDSMRLFGQCAY